MTLEKQLYEKFNRLSTAHDNVVRKLVPTNFKKNSNTNYDISKRQLEILFLIIKKDINTISGISDYLGLSTPNISIIVSKLESLELIEKIYNINDDNRQVHLKLTDKGIDIFNQYMNKFKTLSENSMLSLSNDKRQALFPLGNKFAELFDIDIDFEEDWFTGYMEILIKISSFVENVQKDSPQTFSYSEMKILSAIYKIGINSSIELLRVLPITQSALSQYLKKLESRGYLERKVCKDDKRKRSFEVTPKGIDSITSFNKTYNEIFIQKLLSLDNNQKENLLEIFDIALYILEE